MKILFVGPIVESSDVTKSEAVSPAANQWQLDLIQGLLENGVDVSVLSYLPEQAWPKGRFYVQNKLFRDPVCPFTYIGYTNIPIIRFSMLRIKFIKALNLICDSSQGKPDFLLTYNATDPNCAVGHFFQRRFKGKWISIIADGYSKGSPDGEIFLSYGYYKKSETRIKLHIDGAPPLFKGIKAMFPDKKIILYSGSLDIWTGIEHFVKQFVQLGLTDFELHIYGKGLNKEIERLANLHDNIKLKGFVSNSELCRASQEAFGFINPRPTHLPGVENNFPSKLLQYISFGRPIISSKTLGISPVYDELLNYYDPQDITSLQKQFQNLRELKQEDFSEIYEKSKLFCEQHTWRDLAAQIVTLGKSLE